MTPSARPVHTAHVGRLVSHRIVTSREPIQKYCRYHRAIDLPPLTVDLCVASDCIEGRGGHHVSNVIFAHSARTACHRGCGRSPQPASRDAARGSGGELDPPIHREHPPGGNRRASPAHRGNTLARSGNGPGPFPRRAAGEAAGARPLLGNRLRLAQGRGEAERSPAVHDRDRRARHPLHPRPLAVTRTLCR